mmetsp:Transcript_12989/g.17092  ORF Transcript_12989/g.17092 Transcript_12989/m.17092 type:complete len:349 (+) Transcript_12989:141-1187(+)
MPKKSKRNATMVTHEAEIDRILDERCTTKRQNPGKKKQKIKEYLCAWTDGENPQWVDAKYLKGTPALEDWTEAENDEPEEFDKPEVLQQKCQQLANLLQHAKRPTFMLGAGISAPVLPTFRGKHGLWTKDAHLNQKANAKVSDDLVAPTLAHRGLAALERSGYVYWVATQNYDDLSLRSGFPASKLSELHGNIFTETCEDCHKIFRRDFEVPLDESQNHETGRTCDKCHGTLRDNIVHFEEALPWHELKMANAKFVGSDLTIVLGSSLNVEPAASLPFKSKRRRSSRTTQRANHVCIVNLQKTPYDDEADLLIRGTCDNVIDVIAKELIGESWDDASHKNTKVIEILD